jgi:hypothetical protein
LADDPGERALVSRGEIKRDPWRFARRIEDEHEAIKECFVESVSNESLTKAMDDRIAAINEHSHGVAICETVGRPPKCPNSREVNSYIL